MSYGNLTTPIPGTIIFDGREAMKGYALNKMCYSFNAPENRDAFKRDEEAYMTKYGLNEQQKEAIRKRYVLAPDRCRRKHLLPRQIRRDFRPRTCRMSARSRPA